MATTKSPQEIRATARIRALGQGIRVYCLEAGYQYCVPSASNDGTAYHVVIRDGDPSCNCKAAQHDRYCKHLAAVEMRMEAEQQLATISPDRLEQEIAELYS